MTFSGSYPRFRAPQGDGEILCDPSVEQLPELVAAAQGRQIEVDWLGEPLAELARSARAEILAAASAWTRRYADVPSASSEAPLILTGHQPEMFHPGVWLKNFFAARLAAASGGTAINLIIDSDLCRSPTVRVPVGTADELTYESFAFDQAGSEVPFEERRIIDAGLWQSFGPRVAEALQPSVAEPLVKSWWPAVIAASEREQNLGGAISRSRHELELAWGSVSLELPQSHVCQTRAFRLFLVGLLTRATEFRAAFNDSLAEYREAHRLKNHAQPVPNLAVREEWIETPFWLWNRQDPQRRGVFVRSAGSELEVSDHHSFQEKLPTSPAQAIEKLTDWESQRIKLRSRALATTLFARLLVADLFIHGIGGAKYDQVTDRISQRFLEVTLPPYATVSGTLRLPLAQPAVELKQHTDLQRELREFQFHPERHRDKMVLAGGDSEKADQLIGTKWDWIRTPKSAENAGARHDAITAVNRELSSFLNNQRDEIESQIVAVRQAANVAKIRNSREFAYCLFPSDELRKFFDSKKLSGT